MSDGGKKKRSGSTFMSSLAKWFKRKSKATPAPTAATASPVSAYATMQTTTQSRVTPNSAAQLTPHVQSQSVVGMKRTSPGNKKLTPSRSSPAFKHSLSASPPSKPAPATVPVPSSPLAPASSDHQHSSRPPLSRSRIPMTGLADGSSKSFPIPSASQSTEGSDPFSDSILSLPPGLMCPISLDLMVDPVTIASGQTFERVYIERWFQLGHKKCPTTNQDLNSTDFTPNVEMQENIRSWAAANSYMLPTEVQVKEEMLMWVAPKTNINDRSSPGTPMRRQQFRGQRLQEFRRQMHRNTLVQTEMEIEAPKESNTSHGSFSESNIQLSSSQSFRNPQETGRYDLQASINAHRSVSLRRLPSAKGQAWIPGDTDIKTAIDNVESDEAGAAEKLRSISKASKASRMRMSELGAIPALVEMMSSRNPTVVEHSVTTILNLGLESDLKEVIADAGALKPLAMLAVYAETLTARENAIGALSNLCVLDSIRIVVWNLGVLPIFVSVVRESSNERTRKDALIGLFNLSLDERVRDELLDMDLVENILEVIDNGEAEEEEELALLLYSLSKIPSGCQKILESNGVPIICSMLDNCGQKSKGHVLSILLNMARHSMEALEMVREEATLLTIIILSEKGGSRVREKASALVKLIRG